MKITSASFYNKLPLMLVPLIIAISGFYSYKMFSFVLPLITILLVMQNGGIKNLSIQLSTPFVFIFLLLIWGGFSAFWAINQAEAFKTISLSFLLFIIAPFFLSSVLKLTPDAVAKVQKILNISGFLLICFIVTQVIFDTFFSYQDTIPYMHQIKPTGSILGLTAFVTCALLWADNKKFLALFSFSLLFLMVLITACQTARYGMIMAMAVFGISYLVPLWSTRIGVVASYTFLIFSPALYHIILSPTSISASPSFKKVLNFSLFHRFLGWEYYAKKFFEQPFLGWGAGSSRYLHQGEELAPGFPPVLHPHNNGLQAYVELGMVGGILYALFFASLFFLISKHVKDRLSVAVCNATLTFGFVAAEVTHNMWRHYWLSLAILTAGLVLLFLKVREAQLRALADH